MKCTKTCGIGVAYQSRQCDSPRKETKLSEVSKFDCFGFILKKTRSWWEILFGCAPSLQDMQH